MGAQARQQPPCLICAFSIPLLNMLPPMKSMKAMKSGAKAMSKGALLKTIASEQGFKAKTCSQVINSFVAIATKEVKKTGVFAIPGLLRIKTRVKPATKAGVKVMFGKEMKVAAKPAKTVVKAFAAAALKKQI